MISVSFDTLFSVELLHRYAADNACHDFTIVPSAITKCLLNKYRMIAKQQDNLLHVLISLDPLASASVPPVKKPFTIPPEGLQLTFFLLLNNPLFFNYTSLPAANNNGNIYHFTNRNDNAGSKQFLTNALPAYNNATAYLYEDIITQSNITYQSVSNNNTSGLSTNQWRKLDDDRFMSGADLLTRIPAVSMPAPDAPTVVEVKDPRGNNVFTKTLSRAQPLDLSGLATGKYFLTVGANAPVPIYLNQESDYTQAFGVIDIFVESTLPHGYKIINAADNTLLSPFYSVYFLNRATIWKYVLRTTKDSAAVADSTGIYQFAQPPVHTSPTTIVSQFPIPLSETPVATLQLDDQNISPPGATAYRLSKDPADNSSKPVYYSEIFLNY